MNSGYTCLRCLKGSVPGSLNKGGRPRTATVKRWITTSYKSSAAPIHSTRLSTTPLKGRAASSLEYQGQYAKNEPVEIPTPGGLASTPIPDLEGRPLLQPNNLFHSFSNSPSPEIRRRAAFMKQHAYCPHPSHHQTRLPTAPDDPEARKVSGSASLPPAHVKFECPDCGIPVSCSEEHWADDYESHLEICDTLREINEDDHDLRSGRFFPEFEYPGPQIEEALVNMTNWDTYLYSREFRAINEARSMRQATRLLTYPITIGSVLHELSPYNIRRGGRLTTEGLKSLSALRYTLHPPRSGAGLDIKGLRPNPPPVRIFILGARAESSLPREVWVQLSHIFPRATFHLIFIGPESMANRDSEFPLPERTPSNPFGAIVEDRISHQIKISTFVEYYHTLHSAGLFYPYDPYFDCFMLYHPGLGHPASSHEWEETLPQLLETKVPIICTGYTEWDMQRDRKWVEEKVGGEYDLLMEPGENRFRSLRWDLNDLDPSDISCGNWGVWAFRGKRYETTRKDVD
ncbi:translational activator for mitochondrial COX1 [Xylographa bjoerkii]|nr:translational activator for mitochondrial COX1 [Xylographa bjoerkii]